MTRKPHKESAEAELKRLRKENRESKKALQELSDSVLLFLHWLDAEMRKPGDQTRGKRIAKACNELDLVNDRIRYTKLGVDYRNDDKTKTAQKLLCKK